jgi:hydrogenase-4 component B
LILGTILLVLGLLVVSALIAALCGRHDRISLTVGTTGSLVACAIGVPLSIAALLNQESSSLRSTWTLPAGEIHVGLDPLTAFFLLCIFTVSGLATLYGAGYLPTYRGRRRLAPAVVFFNLLVASMVLVVLARDAILLIVAWEVMSIASFFLVVYEHDRAEVRRAGVVYLIASQVGVVFLFVLFTLLGRTAGSFDFDLLAHGGILPASAASTAFIVALIGFGTKAGFWPVHLWLPDAHPAAPSHVSALMSGVMIKMGIYGLLRTLAFLGPPQPWWGGVVIAVGGFSGILGVLHALGQHDLKRLLAYHSVENIGIITLGIGIGLLGQSHGRPEVAFLGYAGALLHVLNHGLFKGLLFHGAGSVLHGTGTRDIDSLGGLYGRMPTTGLTFLIGSVAISGLPPLNGFVSEWLIYFGAFRGGSLLPGEWALFSLLAVVALALIGGLAAACFAKAFGIVFLGEPRTDAPLRARDPGVAMRAAMILGAVSCVAIGFWPAAAVRLVSPAAQALGGEDSGSPHAIAALGAVTAVALVLLVCVLALALLRALLLRKRIVAQAVTWGCGYEAPTARMQYTAASFAQPLLEPFAALIPSRLDEAKPQGPFPSGAHYEKHLGDVAGERFIEPAFRRLVGLLARARVLQHGRIQLYLAYVFATLVALLLWLLFGVGGR